MNYMTEKQKEDFAKAVQTAWGDFESAHPHQARGYARRHGGDAPTVIVNLLEEDEQYRKLVAQTAVETSAAQIIAAVVPIIERLTGLPLTAILGS